MAYSLGWHAHCEGCGRGAVRATASPQTPEDTLCWSWNFSRSQVEEPLEIPSSTLLIWISRRIKPATQAYAHPWDCNSWVWEGPSMGICPSSTANLNAVTQPVLPAPHSTLTLWKLVKQKPRERTHSLNLRSLTLFKAQWCSAGSWWGKWDPGSQNTRGGGRQHFWWHGGWSIPVHCLGSSLSYPPPLKLSPTANFLQLGGMEIALGQGIRSPGFGSHPATNTFESGQVSFLSLGLSVTYLWNGLSSNVPFSICSSLTYFGSLKDNI